MKINGITIAGIKLASWNVTDPVVKTTFVNIPGENGQLDYSMVLTGGEPTYEPRTLTVKVTETADDPDVAFGARLAVWSGRTLKISPDDKQGYFEGLVSLTSYAADGHTFGYILQAILSQPWRWNDALTTKALTASTAGEAFTLTPSAMTVTPMVTTQNTVTIVVGTLQVSLPGGLVNREVSQLVLKPGFPLSGTVKGSGSVTFSYKDGRLF